MEPEEAFQFWTAERMTRAKPRQKIAPDNKDRAPANLEVALRSELNTNLDFVTEEELKDSPYNSVGRLFFLVNNVEYRGSA